MLTSGFLLLSAVIVTGSVTTCRAGQEPFVQDASFPESHVLAEEAILRKLHGTNPAFTIPATLAGAVTSLQRQGIRARLDVSALEDFGISTDEQVDWHRSPVSLAASLEQSLHDLELTWLIRGGTLLITTNEKAEAEIRTKIYRVSGLIEFTRIPSVGS